jgi:hypothetical protein
MSLYDTNSNLRRILDALDGVKTSGETGCQWVALCPAHDDREQSLSVGMGRDGKILLHCHAGCTTAAVVQALGFTLAILFPEDDRRLGPRPARRKPAAPRSHPQPRQEKKPPDWERTLAHYRSLSRCPAGLARFAANLGLTADSLTAHGAVWKPVDICPPRADDPGELVWPERDAGGAVVGLGYRDPDGGKSHGTGGHRGLIYADGWRDRPGDIYLAEGLTDAAALWDMGLAVIGLPNNTAGRAVIDQLVKLLAEVPGRRVVVLAENDQKADGRHPGLEGARKTAAGLEAVLKARVCIAAIPDGVKDVRAWMIARRAEHGMSAALGLFFVSRLELREASPAAGQPADGNKPPAAKRDPAERCQFPRSLLVERKKDGQLQRWRPWCGTCSGCERRRKRELSDRITKKLETTSTASVPLYCTRIQPDQRAAAVRKLSRFRADGQLAEAYLVHTPSQTLIVSTVPLNGSQPVSLENALGEVKAGLQAAILRGKGKSIASVTKGWKPVKEKKEKLFRKLGTVKRPWQEVINLCQSFGVEIETTLPTEGALLRRDVLHVPDGFAPELRRRLIEELLSGPCATEDCTPDGGTGGPALMQGSDEWREDGQLWREREAFWNQVDAWWDDWIDQWKSTG